MAKVDFTEILSKQVGSAPAPKPLPPGTYIGVVEGLPQVRPVTMKDGTTKGVLGVQVALTEPGDDVDEDALQEAGGLVRDSGSRRTVRADFWLDEDSLWQLDRFLGGFGLEDMTYTDAFQELAGKSVVVVMEQRTYESKGQMRTVTEAKRVFAQD